MATRYLFHCPACSAPVKLSVTQAGQKIVCAKCSASFSAPRLGEIKKLPLADGDGDENSPKSKSREAINSPVKGWLFSGGLLLALIFGAAAYGIQSYASAMNAASVQMRGEDIEQLVKDELNRVDKLPAADIYAIAAEAGKDEFQLEYREVPYRSLAIQSNILQNVAYVCWAISATGVLMLLSSFFVGKK